MLQVPDAELRALAGGEIVAAFADRAAVDEGDEVELAPGGDVDPATLKPAYARWAAAGPPPGEWTAVVTAVHPASSLDPESGSARHVRTAAPTDGDLVVLRVYDGERAVLSDEAFAARVRSLEGALTG